MGGGVVDQQGGEGFYEGEEQEEAGGLGGAVISRGEGVIRGVESGFEERGRVYLGLL